MVCLPLSNQGAPLERLAGWRLVLFVVLEFVLCVLFSIHSPPEALQAPAPREAHESDQQEQQLIKETLLFSQYAQPIWVQELSPALSGKPLVGSGRREWQQQPQAELLELLKTYGEHLSRQQRRSFRNKVHQVHHAGALDDPASF